MGVDLLVAHVEIFFEMPSQVLRPPSEFRALGVFFRARDGVRYLPVDKIATLGGCGDRVEEGFLILVPHGDMKKKQ